METKNNILLVPTDFSEVANNAIQLASKAAKFLNYKLYLLHVTNGMDENEAKKKLILSADEAQKAFGIEVLTLAIKGSIFSTIAEVAKDIGAKLIFMATHGKIGMQKFTGSYALKVITSSDVPVIVVQKKAYDNFKSIVVPITSDFGPWKKVEWATYLAKEFKAKIHLFHLDGEKIDKVINMHIKHFKENGVEYQVKVADNASDFKNQVIDFASSVNAGLIMIMTNPSKGLKFILGSYDEDIIFNSSQIPVMCINPRDANWKKILV